MRLPPKPELLLLAMFSLSPACAPAPTPAAPSAPVPIATPPAATASSAPVTGAPLVAAEPATELWEGKLAVGGGTQLRLVIHATRDRDGALHGTFDSPDQGALGVPLSSLARDHASLAFAMAVVGAAYSGKLNEAGTEAVGEFTQHGATLPLTLRRVEKVTELSRPQMPKPPFPYRAEEVTYANAAGGVTLTGTLTVPTGDGPFPAVLLITGSGAEDRDETLFGHKPFLVIADDLTRKGVAVLRVDDRGVGGSTGNVATSTSEDFAGDVRAGVAFLKTRKEIDPKRIGLVGHSEGGLIAPMVASKSKDVAFLVLLAGPGLPGSDILLLQGALIGRAAGLPEDKLNEGAAVNKRLYAAIASERDPSAAEAKVRAIMRDAAKTIPEVGGPKEEDAMVAKLMSPWLRFFIKYDPRPALAKVTCPVLALNGERDLQVPPKEDLAAIKKANPRAVTRELPGLNHLFQTAKTGLPGEYGEIEETFSPAALTAMSDFILEVTRKK